MNPAINTLVKSIFRKDSLDDCSIEELQQITTQYPYFAPSRILLAEKLKTADPPKYKDQLQTLSLYFNNPLWLDYLLNGYKSDIVIEETKIVVIEKQEPEPPPPPVEINNIETTTEVLREQQQQEEQSSVPVPDPVPEVKKDEEMILSFEPYHTVDYFASQGIKLIQEEKPADRFGKQLKSFTEWLKTMKRLPQKEIAKNIDVSSEQNVQKLADTSIKDDNVVTETMAEVWIKQGNKEKAIEVYNKLSLLNPDKSAYFASLAEQLKNT